MTSLWVATGRTSACDTCQFRWPSDQLNKTAAVAVASVATISRGWATVADGRQPPIAAVAATADAVTADTHAVMSVSAAVAAAS